MTLVAWIEYGIAGCDDYRNQASVLQSMVKILKRLAATCQGDGQKISMLTVIDEFTRETLEINTARRLRAENLLKGMADLFEAHGHSSKPIDRCSPEGMVKPMQNETKKAVLSRLGRIGGQVRGLAKMIEDDRYCVDVVNQVQAVIAALKRAEGEILKDHISHCVEHAIRSGSKAAQREKVQELVDTLSRKR